MKSLTENALLELKRLFEDFKRSVVEGPPVEDDVAASDDSPTATLSSQVLTQITKIEEILTQLDTGSADYVKVLTMKASLLYENGKIHLNNNDMQESKIYLEEGLKVLKGLEDDPQVSFLHLRILNHFSYVLTRLSEVERAKCLLESVAEKTWGTTPRYYTTEALFLGEGLDQASAEQRLKKLLANNMQMLAWIYGKTSQPTLYAEQTHKMLAMELELDDVDLLQWSMKCQGLGAFYIMEDQWRKARYHLAAAQTVLDALEKDTPDNDALFRAQADLARVWVNYCLQLFSSSRKSNLQTQWDEATGPPPPPPPPSSDDEPTFFEALSVLIPDVPCAEIRSAEEAKAVSARALSWLARATFHYTLRDHPTQHIGVVLETSELYRHLAFYETSEREKYSMHKKRYDALEALRSLVREVKPNHYLLASLDLTKEIVDVQIEMMNLNLSRLYRRDEKGRFLIAEDLQGRKDALVDIVSHLRMHVEDGGETGKASRTKDDEKQEDAS